MKLYIALSTIYPATAKAAAYAFAPYDVFAYDEKGNAFKCMPNESMTGLEEIILDENTADYKIAKNISKGRAPNGRIIEKCRDKEHAIERLVRNGFGI